MKSNITDTIIDTFDDGYAETGGTFSGHLVQCISKLVGSGYRFAVTNVVLFTNSGYRMFSVSLPAGMALYSYITSNNRRSRMKTILFEFTVHAERQHVKDYKAYDPEGWIHEALYLERMCPRNVT